MHRFTDAPAADVPRWADTLRAMIPPKQDSARGGSADLLLAGVRSPSRAAGLWDDALLVLVPPGSALIGPECKAPLLRCFPGTTDPGRHWLAQPMRREGCAVLCDGWWPALWEHGLHRGEYPALVQRGAAEVWRDADRDAVIDPPKDRRYPASGINLHHGGRAKTTDWASAGCQVTPEPDDLAAILWFVDQRDRILGMRRTGYLLCDSAARPDLAPLLDLARQKAA